MPGRWHKQVKEAGWGLWWHGECAPYPRKAALTWFPPIVAIQAWSLVLPSLVSIAMFARVICLLRRSAQLIGKLQTQIQSELHSPSPEPGHMTWGAEVGCILALTYPLQPTFVECTITQDSTAIVPPPYPCPSSPGTGILPRLTS